jgi:hypothetical protein
LGENMKSETKDGKAVKKRKKGERENENKKFKR